MTVVVLQFEKVDFQFISDGMEYLAASGKSFPGAAWA